MYSDRSYRQAQERSTDEAVYPDISPVGGLRKVVWITHRTDSLGFLPGDQCIILTVYLWLLSHLLHILERLQFRAPGYQDMSDP